jgi:hypothetical protein
MVAISKCLILLNSSQYYECTENNLFTVTFSLFFSLNISRPLFLIHSLQSFSHPGHQPSSCSTRRPPLLRCYAPPSPTPANSGTSATTSFSTPYIGRRFFICLAPPVSHQRTRASKRREELEGANFCFGSISTERLQSSGFQELSQAELFFTLCFRRASTEAIHKAEDEALPNAPLNSPYQSLLGYMVFIQLMIMCNKIT